MLCASAGVERSFFHEYVRPTEGVVPGETRQLSAFCKQLTGITQEQVNAALPLPDVLRRFEAWIVECGLAEALDAGRAMLVAHGGWDLGDQLPIESARKNIVLPRWLGSGCYTDLKVVFALSVPGAPTSLRGMLQAVEDLLRRDAR